jgi:segregation and condensation protein A
MYKYPENPIEKMDLDEMIERSFWKDILYEIINTLDPWDIDLSELATRYSERVEKMKEMNFRVPANVIIVSSVLLRMKADIMASVEVNPLEFAQELDEGLIFSEFDVDAYSQVSLVEVEEREDNGGALPISIKPRRVPKRRVTAAELITAIQEVLEDRVIKQKLEKEGNGRKAIEIILSRDITELIEETYRKVVSILSGRKKEVVLFSEIVPKREEIVPTFLSLLHLSNDHRVSLKQKRIYDEIFISAK